MGDATLVHNLMRGLQQVQSNEAGSREFVESLSSEMFKSQWHEIQGPCPSPWLYSAMTLQKEEGSTAV